METPSNRTKQEIIGDYNRKPYGLLIAVLVGITGIVIAGVYLFMYLIELIWKIL